MYKVVTLTSSPSKHNLLEHAILIVELNGVGVLKTSSMKKSITFITSIDCITFCQLSFF